jgi:GxxExxY protein
LSANGISFDGQVSIPLFYRGEVISEHRIDPLVEEAVVEVKSVERFAPIHRAQLLTYLRVKSLRVGLLLTSTASL